MDLYPRDLTVALLERQQVRLLSRTQVASDASTTHSMACCPSTPREMYRTHVSPHSAEAGLKVGRTFLSAHVMVLLSVCGWNQQAPGRHVSDLKGNASAPLPAPGRGRGEGSDLECSTTAPSSTPLRMAGPSITHSRRPSYPLLLPKWRYSPRRPRPLILLLWSLMSVTISRVETSAWIDGTSSGEAAGRSGTRAYVLPSFLRIRTLPVDSALSSTLERFCLASEYVKTFILQLQVYEIEASSVVNSERLEYC